MYADFERNFANIMFEAGCEKIELPAYEFWRRKVSLWGKLSGAVAYFYVVYEAHPASGMMGFSGLKELIDQRIDVISARLNMRHTVIINIFAGDLSGDISEIRKLIDEQGEFAFMPKYDIYYGVDTVASQIIRNTKQTDNMDGALAKIETALKPRQGSIGLENEMPTSRYATPVAKYPILCYILMAVNVLLFVLMELDGGSTNIATLIRYGAVSHHLVFTLGEYHRLITPIFLHIGLMHLMANTMAMILFGIRAEKYFGHVKFLIIYVVSGVAGNLAMVLASEFALGAGASGAGYGLMGALFAFAKLRKKNVENFRAWVLGIMIVLGILMGFAENQLPDMPNVGNAAHIGGLVAGLVLGYFLAGKEMSTKVD
ncbi:MAG: rhomboid family intramembrane serine protease [Defluviitaleaceae bacterium]|nr:rhomboid family intramembrane serine protease [Defluviitaleaceae bacterium]